MQRTPYILKFIFTLNVAFLALFAVSYPFVEPGSGAQVASILALVPIVLTMAIVLVLTYIGTDIFDV